MPAPVHARLRIGGKIYGDASWSIGIAFANSNGADPFQNGTTDVQGALEDWADGVRALNSNQIFPSAIATMMGQQVDVGFIRASRIGLDGKESAVALLSLGTPLTMNGTAKHPAQTAVVASLQSGRPGASYRGRVYLPLLALSPNLGRVSPGDTAAASTAFAAFLRDCGQAAQSFGAAVPFDVVPVVASPSKSASTRITSVRVGNRFDSQRRRAEGQEEIYSVAPVPS